MKMRFLFLMVISVMLTHGGAYLDDPNHRWYIDTVQDHLNRPEGWTKDIAESAAIGYVEPYLKTAPSEVVNHILYKINGNGENLAQRIGRKEKLKNTLGHYLEKFQEVSLEDDKLNQNNTNDLYLLKYKNIFNNLPKILSASLISTQPHDNQAPFMASKAEQTYKEFLAQDKLKHFEIPHAPIGSFFEGIHKNSVLPKYFSFAKEFDDPRSGDGYSREYKLYKNLLDRYMNKPENVESPDDFFKKSLERVEESSFID